MATAPMFRFQGLFYCKDRVNEAPRPCLPAGRHEGGLPSKIISLILCPLALAYEAGPVGHLPAKGKLFASKKQDDDGPSKKEYQKDNKLLD